MARHQTPVRKGGAPKKDTDVLDKVLFVRASKGLLDALDGLRARQAEQRPGVVLSRADVARTILWKAIRRAEQERL